MPSLSAEKKLRIISDLANNVSAQIIADTYDVSYATVLRIKSEYKRAYAEGTVDQMVDMDAAILAEVEEQIKSNLPENVADKADELFDGVKGLQRLQTEFQVTASQLNTKIASFILNAKQPSEIESLVNSLVQLQNAFFNKNSTQVNVQNNFGSSDGSSGYNEFLGDSPAQ